MLVKRKVRVFLNQFLDIDVKISANNIAVLTHGDIQTIITRLASFLCISIGRHKSLGRTAY